MTDAYLFICADCVTDHFLSERIDATGSPRKCMSCSQEAHNCWPLAALAEQVRVVYAEHDALITNPYTMVENLTGLSDSICEEIVDCWGENAYQDDVELEDDDLYGSSSGQPENGVDRAETDLRWLEIREDLLHRAYCAAALGQAEIG
jgi:hypothetical protein